MNNFLINIRKCMSEKTKEVWITAFITFLLFPYFKLSIFDTNGTFMDTFYNVLRVLTALFIYSYSSYYCIKNKYLSKTYCIYFIYKAYIFINSTLQHGFTKDSFINFIVHVTLLLIIDLYAHKNPKELIHSLLMIFEIFVIANFILMIIAPNGITLERYNSFKYLLGNRNGHITEITLALTFSLIWKEYGGSKWHFYILLPISIITILIGKSATGFFSLCLFIFLYVTKLYKNRHITFLGCILTYIIVTILIIFVHIQDYLGPVWKLLGRNATFSTRTMIWDKVINAMSGHYIFGFGELPAGQHEIFNNLNGTHNNLLEHLCTGGVIGLLLISLFLFSIILNLKKHNKNIIIAYFILGICSFLVHFLMEAGVGVQSFILFILLSHEEYFSFQNHEK